jgi:hypothetical protein
LKKYNRNNRDIYDTRQSSKLKTQDKSTTCIIECLSLSSPSTNEIEWVVNKGLYYLFLKRMGGGNVIEF